MLNLNVVHQESYSRGELLLRSFFGFFYIGIPHGFCLFFLSIWGGILNFITFWAILFTGSYPQSFFEYQVKLYRWNLRVSARLSNLADGYPAFGLNAVDDKTSLDIPYPERQSRGLLLLKAFFGFIYCLFPHAFVLLFVQIWGSILSFIAWWAVLFTGQYPQSFHEFKVGIFRWTMRVNAYMNNMTDIYPPFTGKPVPAVATIDQPYDNFQ